MDFLAMIVNELSGEGAATNDHYNNADESTKYILLVILYNSVISLIHLF